MKKSIQVFTLIAFCFAGTLYSSAQNAERKAGFEVHPVNKKEMAKANDDVLSVETIAKLQTQKLKELLSLDLNQNAEVYNLCLNIEYKMQAISIDNDSKRLEEITHLEVTKTKALKGILSPEQFSTYKKYYLTNKK